MRRGEGSEMPGAERKRRARQLRLVLRCAGSGSVTGSGSSQCRREGRPHGGFKGQSSQYPLSRPGFDKQEFMEEVKNSANAQYKEEQKCRTSSPLWLPAANKEKNHTGEQPLILQSFLAPNKQEQIDGVLPAPNPVGKRQSKSAGMYRDDPDYFCRGNSTHQYLTATEMPGQSERLVDFTLGRPTRTSLLRVRQRTKSAPGVRAVVEIKTHLHKQQYLAAKTEERYKSADVPQELLPVTENHETVHQFLVGARYNRMYHHDAKCLNKLGLFVSRHDPLHCFMMNVPAKDNQQYSSIANLQGSMSSLSLTESCESFDSDSNLNKLTALSTNNQELPFPKSAWSTTGQDDHTITSKGMERSTTPGPYPANRSRESFTSKRVAGRKNKPKLRVIDGKTLTSHTLPDGSHDCCIMCKSEPAKHYQRFSPGSHFAQVKNAGKEDEDGDWSHSRDHMLSQQYHLRIMGIKYGVESGPQAPPRSNLLYATNKSTHTAYLPTIKQLKNLRSINKNNSSRDVPQCANSVPPPTESQGVRPERPTSNSSKISVGISTHSGADEDNKVSLPEDTPRNDALPEGRKSSKDVNNNASGTTAPDLDDKLVGSEEEGWDKMGNDETVAERDSEVADELHVGDIPTDTGMGQDSTNGTTCIIASGYKHLEQGEDDRAKVWNDTTVEDGEPPTTDGDTKDTVVSHDTTGEVGLKDTSNSGNDALEDAADAQGVSTQVVEKLGDLSAGDIPEGQADENREKPLRGMDKHDPLRVDISEVIESAVTGQEESGEEQ